MRKSDEYIGYALGAMAQSVREDAREMRAWRPSIKEGAAAFAAFLLIPILASVLLSVL